jgi:hypothetical protein
MNKKPTINPNLDITNTSIVLDENNNPIILIEAMVLRKASKFLTGTDVDSLIPIPVLCDIKTNKICLDMLPKEIRNDYKDIGFNI